MRHFEALRARQSSGGANTDPILRLGPHSVLPRVCGGMVNWTGTGSTAVGVLIRFFFKSCVSTINSLFCFRRDNALEVRRHSRPSMHDHGFSLDCLFEAAVALLLLISCIQSSSTASLRESATPLSR